MKNFRRTKLKWKYSIMLVLVLTTGFSQAVYSQTTVSGVITDENNGPLPGASVVVKGTSNGTTADFDGNYTIANVGPDDILVFSYVGYKTSEVAANGRSTIDISLLPDLQALDEVVVVGYGSQKKSLITGAVATVDTQALNRNTTASLDNALQGSVAGISVISNSTAPGGGVSVRIRGAGGVNNSEPLYVVDGFPISVGPNENSSPLSSINPQDIESISVLKDAASAAIYGTRAANGVVLITTKRGRKNERSTVNLSLKSGFQSLGNSFDVMDAQTYVSFINEANLNAGLSIPPGFENPASFGAGTDWIDAITRVAAVSDIQASFSGGTQTSNFFLSLGRFKQEGIVRGSSFERISSRLNVDKTISDKLKVGASASFTKSKQNVLGGARNTSNSPITLATGFYPTIPVFDENGDYAPTPANGFYKPQANPLFVVEGPRYPPSVQVLRANIYGAYKILPNLEFKTNGFYTYGNTVNEGFGRIYDLGAAVSTEQSIALSQASNNSILVENTLSYNLTKDDHVLTALVGQSLQEDKVDRIGVSGQYDTEGNFTVTAETDNLSVSTSSVERSLISYFGRLNYSFKDKYLMTATVRRDGSSKFGSNNKWGTFPSVSLGWRISEESFMPQSDVLSSLKLRGGWGQVGFDGIDDYLYSAIVQQRFNYPFGNQEGVRTIGAAVSGLPNPDLQWETVTQYSVGLDADFFDNRLNFTAEYYDKTQEDMLVPVPQSAVSGISNGPSQSSLQQNIGTLTNKGLEFSISYAGEIGKLSYSIGGNLTTISNEIIDVPAPINAFNFKGNNLTRTENGRSLGEFYGWVADGLFQNQGEVDSHATQNTDTAAGDIRFVDVSGPDGTPDGVIDDNDRTFIGSPVPDFTYGFNLNLQYANFDFSIQGNGVSGNEIFNASKLDLIDNQRTENKLNFTPWSTSNPNSNFPRAHADDPNNNIRPSSYFIEDGSFTRIKVIELGYSIPADFLTKLNISQFRVYASAQNPFTFTNYSGLDPEVGNAGGSNLSAGIDHFVYPIAKVFSIGLNAKF